MKKVFLMLAAMVFFSGCLETIQGLGSPKKEEITIIKGVYGMAISEFSTYDSAIEPGESTTLYLKIVNAGNKTAENVVLRLVNYGELELEDDEARSLGDYTPLGEEEIFWTFTAPDSPGVTYFPSVQICYDYSSVGYKSVKAVDNEVYDSETVLLPSQEDSTRGPVSISFELDHPLIIAEEGEREEFYVLFTNVEVGQLAARTEPGQFGLTNYINAGDAILRIPTVNDRVKLKQAGEVFVIEDAEGNVNWNCEKKEDLYECYNEELIQIVRGKTARIIIEDLEISGCSGCEEPVDDMFFFEAEVNYQYCLTTDPVSISIH